MNEEKVVSPSVRVDFPASWKSVLESAADAEPASLELDDAETEVAEIAERLADLGFLQVYRARHYRLTDIGRGLLQAKSLPVEMKTLQQSSLRLVLPVAVVTLVLGALAWLLV